MRVLSLALVACLGAALAVPNVHAGSYAQLSSSQTQKAAATPTVVTLNNNDALKGIDNNNGAITIKEAGTYFLIAAAQVGGTGKGTVRLWMRQNGADVANSNTEQTITNGSTAVLVCQGVAECKAGDVFQLVVAATGHDLAIVASTPANEPAIPSMIFTAVKLDTPAYAQLSSTQSQPAGASGTAVTLNSTDLTKAIDNNNGAITIKEAGVYFVIAAGQVGVTAPNGNGSVKLWVRQNGADVANSNTEQSVTSGSTAVLICQGVGECKAGDKLELVQSATGTGVGMVASAPKGEPAIPSMIFSAFKVQGSTYAQLSSVKNQPADHAAKAITLENTDLAGGIDNAAGSITVKKTGACFAIAAGQIGGSKGNVRLWLRQNSKDVANSNTEQTIEGGSTSVLICQGVVEVKAGDKLELAQSAASQGVGITVSTPSGEPAIPSMIFSLVEID